MGPSVIIILSVALASWVVGWVLALWAVWRARLESADRGALESRVGPVSVVIPARDEEDTLPVLLRSINAQSVRPAEVIVVDDGSTDRTAEVARELGATVITAPALPEGWRGKTWACHQGAQAATGRVLLFLDADTWFEPGGLGRVLAGYESGAFSVGPYHAVRLPHEQLSLFFNVNMVAGTVPGGLFGQMLLVDRDSYRRVGGHAAVRGRILENLWLAGQCRAAGIPVRSVTGRGVLSFRMYPSGPRDLIAGWTKGFAAGAGQVPRGTLVGLVAWMTGLLSPLILLPVTVWGAVAYAVCAAQVACVSRPIGAFRWYAALLYPVPLLFFFAVFARSAWRSGRPVTWKGRAIRAD